MGKKGKDKGMNTPIYALLGIFIISNLVALVLASPYKDAGYQAFSDPNSPVNPLIYIVMIMIFTGIILLIAKYGKGKLISYIVLGAMSFTMFYVFIIPLYYGFSYGYLNIFGEGAYGSHTVNAMFYAALLVSLMITITMTFALLKYPEWWVVDSVGIATSAGVIAILGISLGILPVMILLVALAIYDAISVYKTKHMIDLADSVTEQHLPVLLVVPKDRGYSYIKQDGIKKDMAKGKKREAMFMGLGDVIIPGILVVSSFMFLADRTAAFDSPIPGSLIVALGTLLGGVIGFYALMHFVAKGRPQAGLPLLNSGVLSGYILTYLLVFRDLGFGITL